MTETVDDVVADYVERVTKGEKYKAVARKAFEDALIHEGLVEEALARGKEIMDQLSDFPELRGTKQANDLLKKHRQHMKTARRHGRIIERLSKVYERNMDVARRYLPETTRSTYVQEDTNE